MVVGKRGGRKKFGAERGGKLEKAGFLACRMRAAGMRAGSVRAGGVRATGQWASRLGFGVRCSQKQKHSFRRMGNWAFRVSQFRTFGSGFCSFLLFFFKKKIKNKKNIESESC